MTVEKKEPDKPGYMTTEFWVTLGVIVFAVFERFGYEKEVVLGAADNWVDMLVNLISSGTGSITLIVIGVVVWGYQKRRAEIKAAALALAAKLKGG